LIQCKQIGLVDEQKGAALATFKVALGTLADCAALSVKAVDVLLEVTTAETLGVACVHNLNDEMRPLEDSPELTPNLEVALEGGEKKVVCVGQSDKAMGTVLSQS
jgi:hypothetical protein